MSKSQIEITTITANSGLFSSGINIANQTSNTIASFDAGKNMISLSTGTYPSLTELSYVKGVTSAIQTQINTKQNTLTNPVTGVGVSGYLARWTASSGISSGILYDNGSGVGIRTITPTAQLHVNGSGYFASGCSVSGILNVQTIKQTVASGTDAATITFNMNTANVHTVTLGGNRTLAVSNVDVGQRFTIRLKQDASPPRTVTWFSGIYWPSAKPPILTRKANAVDVFSFICTASGKYDGYIVGYNFPNA